MIPTAIEFIYFGWIQQIWPYPDPETDAISTDPYSRLALFKEEGFIPWKPVENLEERLNNSTGQWS